MEHLPHTTGKPYGNDMLTTAGIVIVLVAFADEVRGLPTHWIPSEWAAS